MPPLAIPPDATPAPHHRPDVPSRSASPHDTPGSVSHRPPVDRHAICTRRRRRRCGCGASCDARAGDMISGTASSREGRPSRSSRNPQAAAAPLPLLDACVCAAVGLPSTRSSSPASWGRGSHLRMASGALAGVADRVQAHVVGAEEVIHTPSSRTRRHRLHSQWRSTTPTS